MKGCNIFYIFVGFATSMSEFFVLRRQRRVKMMKLSGSSRVVRRRRKMIAHVQILVL
jgi:hypothetical protein